MRKLRKIWAVIIAACLALALGSAALAEDSFSITVANASVGHTYSAYKIFDATYDEATGGVSYTISSESPLYERVLKLVDFFDFHQTTDARGNKICYVTVKDGVSDDAVIKAIQGLGIENLINPSASKEAEGTAVILNVGEPGYYFITSNSGSMVSITTAAPEATIIDKNEEVGGDNFHKYIINENGELVSSLGDAAMGGELDFDITSNVPLYAGDQVVTEYVFTDTLGDTGLEIEIELEPEGGERHISIETGDDGVTHYYADESLIDLFVTLTDGSGKTYSLGDVAHGAVLEFTDVREETIDGRQYVVCGGFILTYFTYDTDAYDEDDPDSFDISGYPTDLTIDIIYTAYVTDSANHTEINTAELLYFTTSLRTPTPENPDSHDAQYSTDTVYEWDLKILKMDGTDSGKLLEGAVFTLYGTDLIHVNVRADYEYSLIATSEMEDGVTYYYLTAEGRYITTGPTRETSDLYDAENPGPYVRTVSSTEVREAGADFTVQGKTNEEGVVIFDGLAEGTYIITEITAPDGYNLLESPIYITVAFDPETGTFSVTEKSINDRLSFDVNDELEITILNYAGTELPSTGGIGTTVFYIAGAALVLGTAVALITRRRMSRGE